VRRLEQQLQVAHEEIEQRDAAIVELAAMCDKQMQGALFRAIDEDES